MFRAVLTRRAHICIGGRASAHSSKPTAAAHFRILRRQYSAYPDPAPNHYNQIPRQFPRVSTIGPTLWSLAAVTAIYLTCAAYEVRRDATTAKATRVRPTPVSFFFGFGESAKEPGPLTWADLEQARAASYAQDLHAQRHAPAASPWDVWTRLSPTETGRFLLGTAGLTSATFALGLAPSFMTRMVHVPAISPNYTLLTSVFAHGGPLHLAMNMYGLLMFGPVVAQSRTFERSASHLAAFYLSSGVLASLAHHLATVVVPAQRAAAYGASLGASGAILAMVATFAFNYPDAKVGIMFLPFSFPAINAVAGFALFDLVGMFVRFKYIRLAHAAHLGGMAVGAVYVKYDGNGRIWKPTRRHVFGMMQRLNML